MPGTLVGIDAEFVALQQEELEIKADGSRSTIRPSRLGLARVSVLRGGEKSDDGDINQSRLDVTDTSAIYVPFIDDYIQIPDPIIDYLTPYSGINPGDLDPKTSPYVASGRLISLKLAYKKVWLLLNLGCIFVGHGLLKDFRTINIHVPKKQVIDTVELYYLKSRGRKLSLRFLSWLVLGDLVQTGETGGHDSVEDARTALRLWRAWKEYEAEGSCEEVLAEIYRRGREYGFKVPVSADLSATARIHLESETSGRVTPSFLAVGDALDMDKSAPGSPRGRSAGMLPVREVTISETK